jgi:putative transcriptional regulator
MTRKRKSAPLPRDSRKASARKQESLGDMIIAGLEEGIAQMRGDIELRTRVIKVPDAIDVRAIREKTGMSQAEFARHYGFSGRTLQEWEQGRARPDSAVRAYLIVIDREPEAVQRALAS